MTLLQIILALTLFGIVVALWCLRDAPEGWEDSDGWHAGRQPGEDD